MTYVGNSWTQLAYWEEATGYGYLAQLRLIAYSTQDIGSNRSTIHWQWQKSVTGGSVFWNDSHNYSVSCGTSTSWNFALGSQSSTAWTNVGDENTTTVTHNSDGTRSVGWSCAGYKYWSYVEAGGTIELPTIPRTSVPTVSPNPITLSSNTNTLTVTTNRKSTSFTHDITCTIGSYTETKTGITDSTTFDIPETVLSDFTATSKTLDGTIECVTKNGSTTIGTKEVTFTAQIDEAQEHPSITSVTLTDTNPNSAAIEAQGSYIKYATNLSTSIVLGVTGSYTQLASAVVQCGTKQQTYALSGTSQTITFTYEKLDADALIVTVYDKRGTTATQTKTWTLIPYRDITVTGSVDRMSETGNTISFSLSGACFGGSFGAVANSVTVTYKYKLHNASTWSDGSETFTFTPSGSGETSYTYSNTLTGFAYDQQFDFQFTVTDMFTDATTRVLVLTVGIPVYGNGEDFFSVYGKSYLHFDRDNPNKFWDLKEGLDAILEYHAQTNLFTITGESTVNDGITFTVNDDGTVKADGTSTRPSGASFITLGVFYGEVGKTYIMNGCPIGGSEETYTLGIRDLNGGNPVQHETGDGLEFTVTSTSGYRVACYVRSGATVDNIVYKPMIRDARIASDEFVQPYPQIFTAEWTATSSSALDTVLTDRVTIPSGTYLVYVHRPTCSTSMFSLCVRANGSDYNNYLTNTQFESICAIQRYTEQTYLEVCATTSASASFSNLERGKLIVARIG